MPLLVHCTLYMTSNSSLIGSCMHAGVRVRLEDHSGYEDLHDPFYCSCFEGKEGGNRKVVVRHRAP